ncbi:MAG TPA: sn-glycerol-3-phosphate import ATP-binding protein UgpC [Alphaproteobacteria bacterium]|jgi:sn-glycerol 3-phosphate transport system ATP-binding protein|nr:sn-glycerol-3-phosphate import ATP-binding protein UgpC [Alphaproteobacteria bacterium]
MAELKLEKVRKNYGQVTAIHQIDLQVKNGEFLVIVGPSGCGKSTLLRMVAGLEAISDGDIYINEKHVNEVEPKDRQIAMVFQNYALYPHMSVFNNMAYGLKIAGLNRSDIQKRVHEVSEILEIKSLLDRKPRQLSGGQRQRVAMGRAIVRNPTLFLFDEPLSNLDAKLRVQMRIEIKQLQRRLGITTLYVTHDQVEAMTLADRLLVMNAGIAEQIGTPLEIYEHPQTTFVAGFIGSPPMNLLQCVVNGPQIFLEKQALLGIPPSRNIEKPSVVLGIRPEHLVLDPQGPLNLTIDLVETLGADTLVYAHLGRQRIVARLPDHHKVSLGDQMRFTIPPERANFFDVDSGKKIAAKFS